LVARFACDEDLDECGYDFGLIWLDFDDQVTGFYIRDAAGKVICTQTALLDEPIPGTAIKSTGGFCITNQKDEKAIAEGDELRRKCAIRIGIDELWKDELFVGLTDRKGVMLEPIKACKVKLER